MTRQKQTEDLADKAEKIKKFIQLGLLLVTVIGAGAKAWFEIDQSKQRDLMLEKRLEAYKTDADKKIEAYKASTDKKIEVMKDNFADQISELKKKSAEDHKTIQDIKTDVAVTRSQVTGLSQQSTVVLQKLEKMSDWMLEQKK